MRKIMTFLLAVLFCLSVAVTRPVHAEELEVLRGDEAEAELYLSGSEAVYAIYGELECTEDFFCLKSMESENNMCYQAMTLEDGTRFLLSDRSSGGYGLWLRLRVEGKRIGTGTVSLTNLQMTNENGEWMEDVELPDITVKVLPNPLEVSLIGTRGNNNWYLSPVTIIVSDKDAAEIRYDVGAGNVIYNGPFELGNGAYVLTVSSDDGYGYKKEEVRSIYIDTMAPTLRVSDQELFWQQETIQVIAEALDALSGIDCAAWAFSEEKDSHGGWNTLTGEEVLSMEQDGTWYLHFNALDMAGNRTEAVYGPFRKDSVKPEISFQNLNQGQLVVEKITPEINITDSCSGIKTVTYLLDGQAWNPSEITGKGKHSLTVTAEDLAGNQHTETVEFSIYDNITVTASAQECHYTGTASFSALVAYRGEPMEDTEAEFYVNGECVGTSVTNQEGIAWLHMPMDLAPQKAVLSVKVPQNDKQFLLAAEAEANFIVKPEHAWMLYGGDYHVWNGAPLRIYLELGELPDYCPGDITRAEVRVELYKIENDGSRTSVEEVCLSPNEWGVITHEFYPATGLYEMKISCTEASCYTAPEIVLHPAVFDMDATLDINGGSLLLDLPQLGLYLNLTFTFLPPTIEAQMEVRIPGTGITLTQNTITGYDLTMDGLALYGKAVNPADGCVYSYEVRTGYAMGFLLDELETSIWKGEDKEQEPVYHFEWNAEERWEE